MRVFKLISDLRLRPLTTDDARELSYIELEIFPLPWDESSLQSFLALANVEGEAAVHGEQIIGYLFAQYSDDEAHILNLGIRPKFRRKGIAKLLLERFLNRIVERSIKSCYLEVRVGNLSAQKLYFSQSFAPIAVRKQYYPDGEDALILIKHF